MARRSSLDDRLAAVRALRAQENRDSVLAELTKALSDRSNLVVAAAAAIAADRGIVELAPALEAAFPRFLVEPLRSDRLCRAKLEIVLALDALERPSSEVFHRAARHVQLEPVWGGSEDTAGPLRAAALRALAHSGEPRLLPLLADALIDPLKDVRIAAVQALGYHGSEAARLCLRLKARLGDREPEVLSECFAALLEDEVEEYLPFVTGHLVPESEAVCEAAILALGRSRLPAAFIALAAFLERAVPLPIRETVLMALGMMRLPAATDFLIGLVAGSPEPEALTALTALKIQAHDPRLRQRIADAVSTRDLPPLRARFDRDFPA